MKFSRLFLGFKWKTKSKFKNMARIIIKKKNSYTKKGKYKVIDELFN